MSCLPRSIIRFRLREGRIRSLLYGTCLVLFALFCGHGLRANAASAESHVIELKAGVAIEEEMALLLKAHLMATTSWKESEIHVRSIGKLRGVELPEKNAVLKISSDAVIIGKKTVLIPVDLVSSGKCLQSFWITAEVCVRAEVLTAAKKINSGRRLAPDDVERRVVELSDLRTCYTRNPEDVLGKISRRSFQTGDPLAREAFSEPPMVRSGETVRLRLERGGIVLTSLAKAQQDGKLGQVIKVRNVEFSALLKAEVTGRAEVKIQ